MNKILQRTYQRTLYKQVITYHTKHYQAQMMRQPTMVILQEQIFKEQSIPKMKIRKLKNKLIMTPNGIRTEPLVIPGAPKNLFAQVEARAARDARNLCEYLENRTIQEKKICVWGL